MSELKLSRIHYLRPMKAAAKHAVLANRSYNRYKPSKGRTNHWYAQHPRGVWKLSVVQVPDC